MSRSLLFDTHRKLHQNSPRVERILLKLGVQSYKNQKYLRPFQEKPLENVRLDLRIKRYQQGEEENIKLSHFTRNLAEIFVKHELRNEINSKRQTTLNNLEQIPHCSPGKGR